MVYFVIVAKYSDGRPGLRTGFVGILFLELNGYDFFAPEVDATQAVLALAVGSLGEADYAVFLADHARRRQRG